MHTPIRALAFARSRGTRGELVGYGAIPFLPLQLLFGCTKSKEFVEFRERRCGSFVPRMDRCYPQALTWEVYGECLVPRMERCTAPARW